jgi:hypothetical protein
VSAIEKRAVTGFCFLWLIACFGFRNVESAQSAVIIRRAHWDVAREPGMKGVKIISSTDYCRGDPRPYVSRVDRKETQKATFLTVFIKRQRQEQICLGVEIPVYKFVPLTRHAASLPLYDFSTTPPTRRWPPHQPRVSGRASALKMVIGMWDATAARLFHCLGA